MEKNVIALGFFDGVHQGHGQLLARCRAVAQAMGVPAAALTFDTHPDTLVTGTQVPLLTQPKDRAYLMKTLYGIDRILVLHFDEALRDMPWEQFFDEILVGRYGACHLVCGHDFRFGAKGKGNAALLREKCAQAGIGCDVIPEFRLEGITDSSTYIRTLVAAGQMEEAAHFLGHPHILSGTVVSGARIGRTIGIPTANLSLPSGVIVPARGVYACRVATEQGTYSAVTNVGVRPTVSGCGLTVEPWLLDFEGDLYGREITLEFWKFLRSERKFPDLASLKAEILRNADQTREFFREKEQNK